MEAVEVFRVAAGYRDRRWGPLPGKRDGNVLAYEFELPERFETWPGRNRVERIFVLLDLGVAFDNTNWCRVRNVQGQLIERDPHGVGSWYVDLVTVNHDGAGTYVVTDQYIDVEVPTDGRPYKILDLDEFADAIESGVLDTALALDGLRRWQRFLDRHLHSGKWTSSSWSDFPPESIRALAELPSPFAEPVQWEAFEKVLSE